MKTGWITIALLLLGLGGYFAPNGVPIAPVLPPFTTLVDPLTTNSASIAPHVDLFATHRSQITTLSSPIAPLVNTPGHHESLFLTPEGSFSTLVDPIAPLSLRSLPPSALESAIGAQPARFMDSLAPLVGLLAPQVGPFAPHRKPAATQPPATLVPSKTAPTVTEIPFPTSGMAGEPYLTKSPEGQIHASWLERDGDVTTFFWSQLEGTKWSSPNKIASGTNWFVNWADVPSITVAGSGRMMAHWLEKLGDDKYAYGVRFVVSQDAGKTWSPPTWLHEDRSPTEHGFVSVVTTPDGYLAVWLDGNGYAAERKEMAVHSRKVGFNGQLGQENVVDSRTCDCCPTTLTRLADGRLVTLYRDRTEDEIRDIQASFLSNNIWSKPVTIHEDDWKINACPVNGPSVDALGNEFAVAWFTVAGGAPKLQGLFSNAAGTSFGNPTELDLGNAVGRVSIRMRGKSSAAALWIEGADSSPNGLVLKSFSADGSVSEAIQVSPISEGRSSGYPRLETDGESLIAMWTVSTTPATIKTARISWN